MSEDCGCYPLFSSFCDEDSEYDGMEYCPLHAAAPALLKAVKQMYPLLVDEDKPLAPYDIAVEWRAAIDKAEGR